MTEEETPAYPNISQSFGIVGIILLSMLLFSPIAIIGEKFIEKEIAFCIYYIFAMGAPILIINGNKNKKNKIANKPFELSFRNYKTVGLIIITTITIQIGFLTPIVGSLPMPEFMQKLFMELAGQTGIFSFISIVIAAPILEELIFRGVILNGLLEKYSPVKSILISSLLFGIVHLNPWQFISAMVIGVFSGWVYYKTKKLSYSIIIHMVNNGFAFFTMTLSNPEDMMNKPLNDTYGGGLPVFMLVTLSAIIIAISGVFLIKKEFKNNVKATHNIAS